MFLIYTTQTTVSSKQVSVLITEPVSPASPLILEPISQPSATSTVKTDAPTATQAVILDLDYPLFTGLTFPMQPR